MSEMLRIETLTKIFSDQQEEKTVLENVSLNVKKEEFLCILGPSGCGKTTLLRCIGGFEKYCGTIFVNDRLVEGPGTDRIMVFQDFNQLFPWKTTEENIQYPLKVQGIKDKTKLKQISDQALEKVKLKEYANYYPYQLSGGMKARVAIAKALALKPEIILMDEPFAALDAMTRRDLQNELLKIANEETCTFIFITHNIQEAVILGTRIIVFGEKGKVVLDEGVNIDKPVTPASPGYGELWQRLRDALYLE